MRHELLHDNEYLAVVGPRVVCRPDVERTHLSGVGPAIEIAPSNAMRMVETKSRRLGHELNSAHAVGRNNRCSFLGSSINLAGNHLTVPVHELGGVSVIVNVHDDAPTFGGTQQGAWELVVV